MGSSRFDVVLRGERSWVVHAGSRLLEIAGEHRSLLVTVSLLLTLAVFVSQQFSWPGSPLGNLYFLPILVLSYFWGAGPAVLFALVTVVMTMLADPLSADWPLGLQTMDRVAARALVPLLVVLITRQRRQMQADLERAEEVQGQLTQVDRLATVGEMHAMMIHELNNPVQALETWVFALRKERSPERTAFIVEQMEVSLRQINQLSQRLLNLARQRPMTKTPTDLNELVQETLALQSYYWKRCRITTVVALAPQLPAVACDPVALRQVLLNMLTNARQAMHAAHGRGSISITTQTTTDGAVEIIIADDGPGVPSELREKIFDPFFTTKAAGEGTGLGLAVSRTIVRQHGGELELLERGGGATFRIRLPLGERFAKLD